ncbi:helix-turn-helix transcriptional regulator [Noviherbaspirillum aridicola]|uniref:AraC family transcriptional regulator n=1 Tax=Noviherbaspirillum aridicola TaxID=2849687 RepID=A0ABQ4PYU8_9BURK|nr:AraC family transcriptional regulator [Noviherbaspirillum aridicola]GIZ50034.1 AraC family transcriptional regulator [Noviherbaspirillum aridicola]
MPSLPEAPVPDAIGHAVFDTLRGANAQLERFAWLGDDMALAVWRRDTTEEETAYLRPGHHTLSCYLGGGYRTERNELPGRFGAPGRLCTLPDQHESRWVVRDQLRLLHLYFLPRHFTRRAVVELDREPRELTLADRTFFEDPAIAQLCARLAGLDWDGADERLRANEIAHAALDRLLHTQAELRRDQKLRGGLSPAARRRLAEFIDAHLDQPLTLGMLAAQACLSEFHLARMFRISFGMPPYAWIAARRIDRARSLLARPDLPLQQVADSCGYADLSHFSHRFRAATGVAPSRYRRIIA